MKRPALIVIDMLCDFLDGWSSDRRESLIQSTKTLLLSMRKHRHPVIWVRQEFEPDLRDAFRHMKAKRISVTIKNTPGCQIVPQLPVLASEVVIVKKRYSAFFGTELDQVLAGLKPDTIILAGINTHACIRTTAIDAYQRDWPVVVASDCIGSYDEEHHAVTLRYLQGRIAEIMSNDAICTALDHAHLNS
jgi:nicotinamidase-related amidase